MSEDDGKRAAQDRDELPAVDFGTFLLSLGHSALMHMGAAEDPSGEYSGVNLPLARQTIDLIALLQDKTQGNLTGEEERILEQLLYDLRSRYLEAEKSRR